jgi:hypothetical protein
VLDLQLRDILNGMSTLTLKTLLARVQTWPKGAQEEAVKALQEIEVDFIIGPTTRQELDQSHQEALRGAGTDMEEVFGRYNL